MRIITLMEDTIGQKGIPAEHGLSLYIETSQHKLLMDTGASDLTWENAKMLGIDISKIDTVIISHGHYDHAGGLLGLAHNTNVRIYMQRSACKDYYHGDRYIGIDKRIIDLPNLHLIDDADEYRIDGELSLFSGITGRRLWPKSNHELSEKINGTFRQDSFAHEQCLVINDNGRQILISGCAHNGILNILDRYQSIYNTCPDVVISGFHMMKKSAYTEDEINNIKETAYELKKLPTEFYTGHCTGQTAFDIMKNIMNDQLHFIHCGDEIEFI